MTAFERVVVSSGQSADGSAPVSAKQCAPTLPVVCDPRTSGLPPRLLRPFKVIGFDWDGTAVTSRQGDAGAVRQLIERLLQLGVDVVVITGTSFSNVDRQLSSELTASAKRHLFVLTNRGSEVHGFDAQGCPVTLWHRVATPEENRLLTAVADAVHDELAAGTGLDFRVIRNRLNRRKIDLIPVAAWSNPPKSAIGDLLRAVQSRLEGAGLRGGLRAVVELTERIAREKGLADARITSDVKHVEIGLTDKSDAANWLMRELARKRGISAEDVLIGGDEFGPIGGVEGSDAKLITPLTRGAVFVSVGPEPGGVPADVISLGGGPARFQTLLACQIALRDPRRSRERPADGPAGRIGLPREPTAEPGWLLVDEGFQVAREHEIESLFTVANGYVGTRGSLAEGSVLAAPATLLAGVFAIGAAAGSTPDLVVAPDWTRLRIVVDDQELRLAEGEILEHRRILDLRQGILWREWRHRDPHGRVTRVRALRAASLADRHLLVQMTSLTPENYSARLSVDVTIAPPVRHAGQLSIVRTELADGVFETPALVLHALGSGLTVAFVPASHLHADRQPAAPPRVDAEDGKLAECWTLNVEVGGTYRMDRLVSVFTARDNPYPVALAQAHLNRLENVDIATLVDQHVAAWEQRWQSAEISVEGDAAAQRALRFAVYHLISAANPTDERVSIGARALTGESYEGHVFWDTEIFMVPFFTYTEPAAARSLLMYRYHTLPAARQKARTMAYRGALYAWESTGSGEEATSRLVYTPDGAIIRIRTGEQEHHISADVAYAVWQYWQATGDDVFFSSSGAEIVLETGRFWASRGQIEADGRYHIRHVIGPDEYHEDVDDDVYTNLMAQWNLERAAETARIVQERWPERWHDLVARLGIADHELTDWVRLARAMETGFDPRTGRFEQFRGYFELEAIDLAAFEPRTAAVDVLLGRERIQQSQVIKQADVVLLLFLLWDRFTPEVRSTNFSFYEPRTAHDSSLSPATYALVAARLGNLELAERYFYQTTEIDLVNTMGNAAGGVHVGALGGLWQAAVFGFAGLRARPDNAGLIFDPHVPAHWRTLRFVIQWRGQRIRVAVGAEPPFLELQLVGEGSVRVAVAQGPEIVLTSGRRFAIRREGEAWGTWQEKAS